MADRILIIEDEDTLRESIKRVFGRAGYEVETVPSAEDAFALLEESTFDVIISDIILPAMTGIELLKKIKERAPEQIVIIMTAYASLETAVEALRAGAYDYVVKPIIHEEIKQIVKNALRQKSLLKENVILKRQIDGKYDFSKIIGRSPALQNILSEVKKIADAKSNVLILGETGTGKELIARAIHHSSKRADKPFTPINCSAIPEALLESELFGHVKGSFTGAHATKKGLFEESNSGTVFLDEIGDLSFGLQSKLLRVLEERVIRPVGGTQCIKVDLRIISATNRNLEECVKDGKFREDLYYRINVFTIKIAPLRERKEDVEFLVRHFIEKYSAELAKPRYEIEPRAMEILLAYNWPGNVRELQNIIERAILISDENVISTSHLPEGLRSNTKFLGESLEKKLTIEAYTKNFIMTYQDRYNENELAELLGITRKALWEKRKRWGIAKER